MIRILFCKSKENLKSILIEGHANSASYGNDIVCASISVLSQSVINEMINILDREDFFTIRDDGYLRIDFPNDVDDLKKVKLSVLVELLETNFKILSSQYPKNIVFNMKEV